MNFNQFESIPNKLQRSEGEPQFKSLVCTLNLYNDDLCLNVRDSHASAARRWGSDYLVFREPLGYESEGRGEFGDKLLLDEHCRGYDRIIYLDRYAIVRSDCPNLFDLVPSGTFGGVLSEQEGHRCFNQIHKEVCKFVGITAVALKVDTEYINGGVLVFDLPVHGKVFAFARKADAKLRNRSWQIYDQGLISLAIKSTNTLFKSLPAEFNRCGSSSWQDWSPKMPTYVIHHYNVMRDRIWKLKRTQWEIAPVIQPPAVHIFGLHLPDPEPYNGAVLCHDLGNLIVYRRNSRDLGYCWLDGNGHHKEKRAGSFGLRDNIDPRLLTHAGKHYLMTAFPGGVKVTSRLEFRELKITTNGAVQLLSAVRITWISGFPGYRQRREKNWAPFSLKGHLYCVYSLAPHRVIEIDLNAEEATLRAIHYWTPRSHWTETFGAEFRLNTPPVRLSCGQYLGTFHTISQQNGGYFNGFYTFEDRPPFRVLKVSPLPVIRPEHATGKNKRNVFAGQGCVFPVSLHVDELLDVVRLYAGDNDGRCVLIELSLQQLLQSLV